jgi:hypothetical protein
MRRVCTTIYEYLALWFGLGLLGIMCVLWSPVSFVLLHAMPRARGGEFGRYMNMFWFRPLPVDAGDERVVPVRPDRPRRIARQSRR